MTPSASQPSEGSSAAPRVTGRRLDDTARKEFVVVEVNAERLATSPNDGIPMRFLAKHEISKRELGIRWLKNRPASDWNAVQPAATGSDQSLETPGSIGEFGLAHIKRQLVKMEKLYATSRGVKGRFEIDSVENVLSQESIERYQGIEKQSAWLPSWGFHSSNADSVDSIAKYGLLAAGDSHPLTGLDIGMRHGSLIGEGVYIASNLDLSVWFAENQDERGILQTVVCLVSFGNRVRHLKHPCLCCQKDFDSPRDLNEHYRWAHAKEPDRDRQGPPGHRFSDYQTLVSPDQKMWVVRDVPNARILPVLVVRFYWSGPEWTPARLFHWQKMKDEVEKMEEDERRRVTEKAEGFFPLAIVARQGSREIERIYWGLSFRPGRLKGMMSDKMMDTHLFVICERGSSGQVHNDGQGRALGSSLNDFVKALACKSCTVSSFGGDDNGRVSMRVNVDPKSFFASSSFADLVECRDDGHGHTMIAESLSLAVRDAVGAAIKGHEERFERVWLEEVARAEKEMYTPPPVRWDPNRPISNICKDLVESCADRAVLINKTLRAETERRLRKSKMFLRANERYVFLIVFHSNLEEGTTDKGRTALYEAGKYLESSGLQSYSRLLKVGTLDKQPIEALNASWALSTVIHPARNLVYSGESASAIQKSLLDIREEVDAMSQSPAWSLSVPFRTAIGDGFVVSPDLPPTRSIHLGDMSGPAENVNDDDDNDSLFGPVQTVLFQTQGETPPPSRLFLGEHLELGLPLIKVRLSPERSLVAFTALGLSARAMAARGRSVKEFISLGAHLVDEGTRFLDRESIPLSPEATQNDRLLRWMRARKRMTGALTLARELLNEISTASRLFSSGSIAALCSWMIKPLEWKFGKRALKRSVLPLGVDDMDEEALVELARKELGVAEEEDSSSLTRPLSLMELMYLYPLPSACALVRCKVAKTESAVVDPFTAKVEFVSGELALSSSEVLCELDAQIIRKDASWGARVPDALVVLGDDGDGEAAFRKLRSKMVFRALNAVVLTRNPTVQVPDQHLALLFASFARACEQLLRWRDLDAARKSGLITTKESEDKRKIPEFNEEDVVPFVRTATMIFRTLKCLCDGGTTTNRRIGELTAAADLTEPEFVAWLPKGESSGVSSVCEILAVVCCNRRLFSSLHSKPLVAVALLAESIARQSRVTIRKNGDVARQLLRNALGITLESCPDVENPPSTYPPSRLEAIHPQTGFAFTVDFFSRPCPTNCSPWSVVACLGLARLFWQGASPETVFKALKDGQDVISMKAFVAQFLPAPVPPKLLQIALFAQGVVAYKNADRASKAATLVAGLRDPKALLHRFAREEREAVHRDRVAEMRLNLRAGKVKASKEMERQLLLAEQDAFFAQHSGAPRVFAPGEIAILNRERASDDQLELDPGSGLLKHHCCFESCPEFLKSLQTEKDRWTGKRTGLFKHLSKALVPRRLYSASLHLLSRSLLIERGDLSRKIRCTRKEYKAAMIKRLGDQKATVRFEDMERFDALLDGIYDHWTRKVDECKL